MFQNVPNLPFTNAKIAASVGLTVDDFQALPVTRAACNVLFDGLAESRSGLIPYKARRCSRETAATQPRYASNPPHSPLLQDTSRTRPTGGRSTPPVTEAEHVEDTSRTRRGHAPQVLDERRARMVGEGGAFDQAGFRVGWAKSCILFIFGLFFFGKANFIWVLLAVKFAHDWQPDLIPGPKEMGLFKVWGIV